MIQFVTVAVRSQPRFVPACDQVLPLVAIMEPDLGHAAELILAEVVLTR
jgi:hypothetical protein